METTREYKDRLFKFIFGNPQHKEWTLSLYNAINGSNYTNTDDLEFTTIENAVYMSMKNDVSFLVNDTMNLYEQQSTFNPNMPVRFLIYSGMIYSKHIDKSKKYHIYSTRLQKLPIPRCICFYNGKTEKDDRTILRLSDAFSVQGKADIEVTVTMINVNYGHNNSLLEDCMPLGDYSFFVERVRQNYTIYGDADKAIDRSLEELPDNSLIKPFLMNNKAEVKNMCITEYNEEKAMAVLKEEFLEEGIEKGIEQGIQKGIEKGKFETLSELVKNDDLPIEVAAKKMKMTVEEFKNKMSEL
ncbi:hypothetical protein [uncultured Ruminococcus sp.]|uniref:hypothetical protein n=1 Tax=uncultured Ruminococcus sp. TaxID=165186 RepID=UPI0025E1B318|nr:hypothetical protein [uncultured Ruminococcus sp.]